MSPRDVDEDFVADIKIVQIDPRGVIPKYTRDGDAAVDLCSLEYATINPGHRFKCRTGIAIEIPSPYCGLILPRSGLVVKHGLTVLNSPGLIDCNYRGEVMVVLHNSDPDTPFKLVAGARIAQLLILETPLQVYHQVNSQDDFTFSNRGEDGFGSSGS